MWTWVQRETPHPIGLVRVNQLLRVPKNDAFWSIPEHDEWRLLCLRTDMLPILSRGGCVN